MKTIKKMEGYMASKPKLPRTRAEAIEEGERFYLPAEPCKRGHISKRYTLNGRCYECYREKYLHEKRLFDEARKKKASARRPATGESA